jgi:MoxR-like ATPase
MTTTMTGTINQNLVAQLQALRDELTKAFPEREDAIEALLLAVLSKEHVFVVGPPGTGKSLLTRLFTGAFLGSSYYECAMSKTRSAEAVLGPLDILEFRNNGNQWRKRKGFITDVNFAFVDEIGKMSPVLGHDLLALFNERVYHEVNGQRSVHPAPLYTAFTASNEMLTDDSDDAAALWDRLLFRVIVDYLQDHKSFVALMQAGPITINTTIDWDELRTAIDTEVPAVALDKEAMKGIIALRKKLAQEHIHPSDRRWRASMRALQAKAYLEGRDVAYEEDLAALRFTLWDTVPQIEKIERLTTAASNPFVDRVHAALNQLTELASGIDSRKDKSIPERAAYAKEIAPKLGTIRDDLDTLLDEAKGRHIPKFKEAADKHLATVTNMYITCFEQEPDVAEAAASKKAGKGNGTKP